MISTPEDKVLAALHAAVYPNEFVPGDLVQYSDERPVVKSDGATTQVTTLFFGIVTGKLPSGEIVLLARETYTHKILASGPVAVLPQRLQKIAWIPPQ